MAYRASELSLMTPEEVRRVGVRIQRAADELNAALFLLDEQGGGDSSVRTKVNDLWDESQDLAGTLDEFADFMADPDA